MSINIVNRIKVLSAELTDNCSLPNENEMILKIVCPRGNNLHKGVDCHGESLLVSMPKKFRKSLWIKRGNFVLAEPIKEVNKVKAEITRILYEEHIRQFVEASVWPIAFLDDVSLFLKPKRQINAAEMNLPDSESDQDDEEREFMVCNPNGKKTQSYRESSTISSFEYGYSVSEDEKSDSEDDDDEENENFEELSAPNGSVEMYW